MQLERTIHMTHYAVSQIVNLIQENLHNPGYYDVSKSDIETQLRKLIHNENPKRYPPVTKRSKYSLDETFKDKAIEVLVQFDRKPIPTKKELFIKTLDVEYLEDGSQWFKITKCYKALDKEGLIPNGMTVKQFWTKAHKSLTSFERIYIKTISFYSQYPNAAIVHYKVDDLVDILEQLNNHCIINCTQLIKEIK